VHAATSRYAAALWAEYLDVDSATISVAISLSINLAAI